METYTWHIQKVEASVTEEVMREILTDLSLRIEIDLVDGTTSSQDISVSKAADTAPGSYLKSLSSICESSFPGYPGMKASLKPGPT